MNRPPGVPEGYVCAPCSQCQQPTWYPPAAEAEAARSGVHFTVVCQRVNCLERAVDKMGRGLVNPIDAKWNEALANPGRVIDIGRLVACDECGEDYTDSPASGGFVWLNRATCPQCADRVMKVLPTQQLQRLLEAGQHCPTHMSFADWVREVRASNNTIQVNPP